jgi:hypothetical protein
MIPYHEQSMISKCQIANNLIDQLRTDDWKRNLLLKVAKVTQYNMNSYLNYSSQLMSSANRCIEYVHQCQNDGWIAKKVIDRSHLLNELNVTIGAISDGWFGDYYRAIGYEILSMLDRESDYQSELEVFT